MGRGLAGGGVQNGWLDRLCKSTNLPDCRDAAPVRSGRGWGRGWGHPAYGAGWASGLAAVATAHWAGRPVLRGWVLNRQTN